ncbi:MAG: two-component regulator propeller domain-containing protein [Bacteroidota bacterium]
MKIRWHNSLDSPYPICQFAVILIILFLPYLCTSQKRVYYFDHYGKEEGLPQLQVYHIMQDSYGFLWLSTISGLIKFDGYTFTPFHTNPNDNTSIPATVIKKVYEDSQKRLWVLHASGISLYNREKNEFKNFIFQEKRFSEKNREDGIEEIFEDSHHRLWIGSFQRIMQFFPDKNTFITLDKTGNLSNDIGVRTITENPEGKIAAATANGFLVVNTENLTINKYYPNIQYSNYNEQILYDLLIQDKNKYWLATNEGLRMWNTSENKLQKPNLPDSIISAVANDLIRDSKYNIWVATNGYGLYKFNYHDYSFTHFKEQPANIKRVKSKLIYQLFIDQHNDLWFSTLNGIQKVNSKISKFPLYQIYSEEETTKNHVLRVFEDHKGSIWLTNNNQNSFYSPNLGSYPQRLKGHNFSTFISLIDKNVVWAGEQYEGIFECTLGDVSCTKLNLGDTLENCYIHAIKKDLNTKNIVWISTTRGLCRLNTKTFSRKWYIPNKHLSNTSAPVNCLSQLQDGNFLLTYGRFRPGKLAFFDPRNEMFIPIPFRDSINMNSIGIRNITISEDSVAWMATTDGM